MLSDKKTKAGNTEHTSGENDYIYKLKKGKKKITSFKARTVFSDFFSLPENDLVEMDQCKKSEIISEHQN